MHAFDVFFIKAALLLNDVEQKEAGCYKSPVLWLKVNICMVTIHSDVYWQVRMAETFAGWFMRHV